MVHVEVLVSALSFCAFAISSHIHVPTGFFETLFTFPDLSPDALSWFGGSDDGIRPFNAGRSNWEDLVSSFQALSEAEQAILVLGSILLFLVLGFSIDSVAPDFSIGPIPNSALALIGAGAGAYGRIWFLSDRDWQAWEPLISVGTVTVCSTTALVAGLVVRNRFLE